MILDFLWPEDLGRDDESGNKGPVYPEDKFERRFRIPRNVFNRIFSGAVSHSEYLRARLKPDATNRLGVSPLQKYLAGIKQLAYRTDANFADA